ncbi:MAG: serine hydrolase domain-containing protein [Steroidobacter sp.]
MRGWFLRTAFVAQIVLLCAACATPARVGSSLPADGGGARTSAFSAERLTRIDRMLQQYVDEGRIGGAVALVLEDGRPVYERAIGWRDSDARVAMTNDTIFRIASQTKAITSVAILMLLEEGKLTLSDPVGKFIPEYTKTSVAVQGEGGVDIVPAKRAITIRDLLTHTAGVSYGTQPHVAALYEAKGLGPAAGAGWYTADKNELVCVTMARLASLPFLAQPGEAFVYGYSTDILGCVVERASGASLAEFVRTRITQPLAMHDTHFYLPSEQRARLATVYGSGADGKAVRSPDGARGQGHYVDGPRRSFSGGAGLVSTARDYGRFLEMIRNDGELEGVRILAPRTVALMRTNQVGELLSKGLGFGFGFQSVERYGASGMDATGAFGWGGAYGSTYRVDPGSGVVILLMIQLMPNHTDIQEKFANLVYQAMTGARK